MQYLLAFIAVRWRPHYGAKVPSKVPSSMRSMGALSRGQPSLWLCRVRAHSLQRQECLQGNSRVAMERSMHTMHSRSTGAGTGTIISASSCTIRSSSRAYKHSEDTHAIYTACATVRTSTVSLALLSLEICSCRFCVSKRCLIPSISIQNTAAP
jgi:hypothetical protein